MFSFSKFISVQPIDEVKILKKDPVLIHPENIL